jgi:hypothetical protein
MYLTISSFPALTAKANGKLPLSVLAFIFAPFFIRISTKDKCQN